jgi:hypothetical protein
MKADITKKEFLILEMKTTITFSISLIEKTEEKLKEEIANKIKRNRFLQYQDRVNYSEKEKNIIVRDEKTKEFETIQKLRASYYNVRTIAYFLPYMFLVEDDKKPSYVVAIPAKAEDCFNLIEYLAYYNMMDVINKLGYNIIPNLHVNLFDLGKIKTASYRIPKSKIPSFSTLTVNEIEILLPSMQIELSADCFKPQYRYEMMSNTQIQFILKIIPIDQKEYVIFKVLNQAVDMMICRKNRLGENFKLDINTRIKLAVIYNYFGDRFLDLCGILNRSVSVHQHTFFIF